MNNDPVPTLSWIADTGTIGEDDNLPLGKLFLPRIVILMFQIAHLRFCLSEAFPGVAAGTCQSTRFGHESLKAWFKQLHFRGSEVEAIHSGLRLDRDLVPS